MLISVILSSLFILFSPSREWYEWLKWVTLLEGLYMLALTVALSAFLYQLGRRQTIKQLQAKPFSRYSKFCIAFHSSSF